METTKVNFSIPKQVREVIEKLSKAGYKAYMVGGCVRDTLLDKLPKDYDITTNATPAQIKEVFKEYELINNNGEKHGTVTVRIDSENYEITTFRIDGDYVDHRRPDMVAFTSNLEDDLARRDFTINAMACDLDGNIYNPTGYIGEEDLKNRVIRAVGNPEDRFKEDALRILRMIRFASVLDFNIEYNTLKAGYDLAKDLTFISVERIREEFNKIIAGKGFPRLFRDEYIRYILEVIGINSSLSSYWLLEIMNKSVDKIYPVYLSYLISFDFISSTFLTKYKYSKAEFNVISIASELLTEDDIAVGFNPFDRRSVVKMFYRIHKLTNNEEYDDIIYQIIVNFYIACHELNNESISDTIDFIDFLKYDVIHTNCYTLRKLAINGKDLLDCGFQEGPELKLILEDCLNKVVHHVLVNEKEALLKYVKNDRPA